AAGQFFPAAVQGCIDVSKVNREKCVVFANGGVQQHRLFAIQAQGKAGKVARFGVEQSKLRFAKGLDVAVAIKNGEGVAELEYTCAVVGERGRRSNVVFIFDADNVRQNKAVPEWGQS